MARAATRSPSLKPVDPRSVDPLREEPARLRLGWAPTRLIPPVQPTAGTAPISAARREAATSRAPKSPPPIKGQTGPRPGY